MIFPYLQHFASLSQRNGRSLTQNGIMAGVACRMGSRPETGGKSGLHRAACRLTAGKGSGDGILTESATENKPPDPGAQARGRRVRVKWCGKSAPRTEQSGRQGKPHAEQDQIGEEERPAPMNSRVGRWSRTAMSGQDEWLPPARVQKPAYSPAGYSRQHTLQLVVGSASMARPHNSVIISSTL
jgi:hypothetical protein